MSEDPSDLSEHPRREVILCIDDEPNLLAIRTLVLEGVGYRVIGASDGSTGLELFRKNRVDMVILDHFLPGMSGVEVIAEMKILHPDVPIILTTGLFEPPEGAEHADLFLTKGTPTQEFVAKVKHLMRSKQERRSIA